MNELCQRPLLIIKSHDALVIKPDLRVAVTTQRGGQELQMHPFSLSPTQF